MTFIKILVIILIGKEKGGTFIYKKNTFPKNIERKVIKEVNKNKDIPIGVVIWNLRILDAGKKSTIIPKAIVRSDGIIIRLMPRRKIIGKVSPRNFLNYSVIEQETIHTTEKPLLLTA